MKLSDLSPQEWYARLNARRMAQYAKALPWWQYMTYEQPLVYVARLLAEQGDRFPPLLLPWAELVVETVDERLRWESFLLADDTPSDELNEWWLLNEMDECASEANIAAMVSGRHFLMVGAPDEGEGDAPMFTYEYEDQVAIEVDPRTRQPVASLKVWHEDGDQGGDELAELIRWDGSVVEFRVGEVEDVSELGGWHARLRENKRLPQVPVIPILCNPRRGQGHSDLMGLKSPLDAANQFATNMMAAGEHHAVPRKWAVGVTEKDFVDENGKQLSLLKAAMGDVWAVPHAEAASRGVQAPEVKLGQFSASDLRNFHESIKTLAQVAASKYGLPPSYIGYSSDNPVSAEAIMYAVERLVLRTERRQGWIGYAYEQAARVAWALQDRDQSALAGLEAKWRSAATPTMASAMDAVAKGLGAGAFDEEQGWIMLGFSEQTKKGLRKRMFDRGAETNTALRDLDRLPVTLPEVNGAPALRS